MPQHLFVYGTLMRGDCRHAAIADQWFLGTARTAPRYRMFDIGDYPGLVRADDGVEIEGELYLVSDAALARLDDVEGVSEGLYARRNVELLSPHAGLTAEAYYFQLATEGLRDCGGRWHARPQAQAWDGGPPPDPH